eukprot:Nk52_evm7s272 gene=Nk52_evmTU7s272
MPTMRPEEAKNNSGSYSELKELLKDGSLLKTQGFVNGKWTNSANEKTFPVLNPATNELLVEMQDFSGHDTQAAIDVAEKAFVNWRKVTGEERSSLLLKFVRLMEENIDDLAVLLSLENGKPLDAAVGEVKYTIETARRFADDAKRITGEYLPNTSQDRKRFLVTKSPVGVCALLGPWNFPYLTSVRKFIGAVAAGCTSVFKPSEETPLGTAALIELTARAGFPAGVVNYLPCSRESVVEVGDVMTASPTVGMLSFTGSSAVGKILYQKSAPTVKKLALELGGNAPFIVFKDADVDAAVKGAVGSKFANCGQVCVSANRIYVHEDIYDEFAKKMIDSVNAIKVGKYNEDGVTLGPLINTRAVERVEGLVENAKKLGAEIAVGGARHNLGGNFFQPTVILNATAEMDVHNQEIFGPVACLYKFSSEEEVVDIANNVRYGLAAYFYTQDAARMFRVSELLEAGGVAVNSSSFSSLYTPFGGYKESGIGREGGPGIEEYLETKSTAISFV